MDTYTIKKAYPWSKSKFLEIEISSENLLYTELHDTHSGCQANSWNTDKIHLRCKKIADLIREIESLSNPDFEIRCEKCNKKMITVRPGKYECPSCL